MKGESEPWFATLVRIDRKSTNTSKLNKKEEKNNDQEIDNILDANNSDSALDIIDYNNNLNNLNNELDSLTSNNNLDTNANTDSNRPFCGGSLISDRYILTSANCLKNLNLDQFLIILNLYSLNPFESRDMLKLRPDKIIIHPQYDEKSNLNNIALIRLARVLEFRYDLNVLPLCLVQQANNDDSNNQIDYYPGILYTLGYGRLFNNSLNNPLINRLTNNLGSLSSSATTSNQQKQYPNKLQIVYFRQDFFWCFFFFSTRFLQNRICTVDNRLIHLTIRDVCEKDDGGSLIWFNETISAKTLVGISNNGYCTGFYPPTFVKISSYLKWIDQATNDSEYCRYPDLN